MTAMRSRFAQKFLGEMLKEISVTNQISLDQPLSAVPSKFFLSGFGDSRKEQSGTDVLSESPTLQKLKFPFGLNNIKD